jgi:hypothetical protein
MDLDDFRGDATRKIYVICFKFLQKNNIWDSLNPNLQ